MGTRHRSLRNLLLWSLLLLLLLLLHSRRSIYSRMSQAASIHRTLRLRPRSTHHPRSLRRRKLASVVSTGHACYLTPLGEFVSKSHAVLLCRGPRSRLFHESLLVLVLVG